MDYSSLIIFIFIGFVAQIIDGTLGMAYGVISNSLIIGMGVPSSAASASVHTAETFTTLVSGISHFKLKNIDFSIFKKLVIPGVIGGAIGAYFLSNFSCDIISLFINIYLLLMGVRIIYKSFRKIKNKELKDKYIPPIGFVGGLMDAIGGRRMGTNCYNKHD